MRLLDKKLEPAPLEGASCTGSGGGCVTGATSGASCSVGPSRVLAFDPPLQLP